MSEATGHRSVGKRANELNATIRYTMWSVFRLARPLADQQRGPLADELQALVDELAGKPVELIFPDRDGHPRHPRLGTLFIPNTVAVVKGCPNPDGARRLVNYLLSPEVEKRLAEGGAYQIPLNPAVRANLPAGLETPRTVKPMAVDWQRAADLWDESQRFLLDQFTR